MQEAAKQARGDDTHLMKVLLPDILLTVHGKVDPPIKKYKKSKRGFNHPLTGKLLCPAGRNWDDPEYALHMIYYTLMFLMAHSELRRDSRRTVLEWEAIGG